MASKFGYDEDEDDVLAPKEPQINSEDPEERKAARALRIKRRQEAIKRAEQPPEEAAAEEEVGHIERSTVEASEECQRLALDGAAKVTNVKVTTDEREVFRRTVYAQKMKESMDKIEEEVAEAQLQYDAITANWDAMLTIKDPLDIDAAMNEQKLKCDELLKQKDQLIDELKDDLQAMDEAYYKDLAVQDKDIKELSDRIEKQVTIMQRAYEKQLTLIEEAINVEREAMVDHNNKRWESLYKLRDKEELQHIDYKARQLEEFKEQLDNIMWDHHEKYREAKIELETLLQELQKELEKLKATCLINSEKIGYNYQILKKREEENVFVRSQQKRKLNKMSDIINALRAKIRKAAEDGAVEEVKADEEIKKLMSTMMELEKKSRHFAQVNDYKFAQVWRMSTVRCAELVRQLRRAEVAMHAHILSETPPSPPPKPPKCPLLKPDHAATVAQDETDKTTVTALAQIQREMKNEEFKDAKDKLVRHILQLVADNTGFLIEDRLFKLIEKYELSSRNLCTLDAIFMALEIQAEDDVELLCKVFMDYAFCPTCVGREDALTSEAVDQAPSDVEQTPSLRGRASSVRTRASIARSMSTSTSRSGHVGFRGNELSPADQLLALEAEAIIQKCGDPQAPPPLTGVASDAGLSGTGTRRPGTRGVTVSSQPDVSVEVPRTFNPFLCSDGHYLEIEPMQVLTALGEFVSVFVPPEKRKLYDLLDSVKPPDFTTVSRNLKEKDIESYWVAWKNVFPPEKERFWDGFITALNKYLTILQEREKLHDEVEILRKRNAALRQLIRGALPKLPAKIPDYARPSPAAFTAPTEQFIGFPPI